MANVEVRLKVSKSSYEAKISALQGYMSQLDNTVSRYENLRVRLDSFMDGSDDNYENMVKMVDTNIASVRKSRELTEQSIKMLQETLSQMDEFGQNVGTLVETGLETAKTSINAGIQAATLFD